MRHPSWPQSDNITYLFVSQSDSALKDYIPGQMQNFQMTLQLFLCNKSTEDLEEGHEKENIL